MASICFGLSGFWTGSRDSRCFSGSSTVIGGPLEAAQILTGFGSFFGGVFGLGVAGGLVRSMAFFVLRLTITCTMFSSLLAISALIGPTFWVQQTGLPLNTAIRRGASLAGLVSGPAPHWSHTGADSWPKRDNIMR